jgi:hypothetical protein
MSITTWRWWTLRDVLHMLYVIFIYDFHHERLIAKHNQISACVLIWNYKEKQI